MKRAFISATCMHAQRINQAVDGMREMLNDAMQVHLTMADGAPE